MTVWTNASGQYEVFGYSNKAGTVTYTVTVGTLSRTTSAIYADAAANTGTVLTITAPATVAPGTTLRVSGKLVDKFGNPVAVPASTRFSALYTGPGFAQAAPTSLDKDGEFTMNVLFGSMETGAATITARYDRNNDGDFTVRTVTIAAPAVVVPEVSAVIGSFNGRWAVRVENAKGAVVSVKVGSRWVKYTSLNDNYLFSRKSRVGATVPVAVYVNGTLENVATITIK